MANVKITDLTEDTAPVGTDLVETVDDPSGTPASKKATLDNINAAFDHGVKVYRASNKTITTTTTTIIDWDAEDYDTDAYHDNASNNTRLTVPSGQGGVYLIGWHVYWDTNTTGMRQVRLLIDGSGHEEHRINPAVMGYAHHVGVVVKRLSASSYAELQVYHEKGSDLDVLCTSAAGRSRFWMQRIA